MSVLQLDGRTEEADSSVTPVNACVSIRELGQDELADWDGFVSQFQNSRVVHTAAWIKSLADLRIGEPLFLLFEKQGRVVGCLPGLVVRIGWIRAFGSPIPGWQTHSMGPVFDPLQVSTEELMGALIPYLENNHRIHHIEIVNASLDRRAMTQMGFRGEVAFTYRASMFPGDEKGTLKRLKDSAKRNIRRAERLGLIAKFEDDESFVDEHFDQIKEVFVHGGNIVPFTRERVLSYFRNLRQSGNLAAISVYMPSGENIATGMFTIHGRELLLWMWAHRTQYRWHRPTELMTWTVMQKAMAQGCDTFDFMGRGEFKTRFGAEPDLSNFRWVRSRYRWMVAARDFAEKAYRFQQGVRGRLARRKLASRNPQEPPSGTGDVE